MSQGQQGKKDSSQIEAETVRSQVDLDHDLEVEERDPDEQITQRNPRQGDYDPYGS